MKTTIDWKEVKRIMVERDIDSYAHLSRLTSIHKNSMGRVGPFASPTLDKLAAALECHPCKLIKVEGMLGDEDDQTRLIAARAARRE